MTIPRFLLTLAIFGSALPAANATLTLAPLFGSNMVLQRGKPVPVTGTAAASKSITVTFNGQNKSTTSDAAGNWQATLDAMTVNATSGTLTATEAGANTVTLTNVVVGDVWICSGQSNMAMGLGACNRQTEDVSTANYPVMRTFTAPLANLGEPTKSIIGSWTACSPTTAANFSAVAFYFGRKICQDQSSAIPIGLFVTSVGGTCIDPWLAPEGCTDIPVIAPLYSQSILPWGPFALFNGMVYPYAPLPAKGAIWYQGENRETTSQSTDSYFLKEKALQQGWQRLLGLDDFPLYVVQIANWLDITTTVTPDAGTSWADTRVQQTNVLGLPHAGVAVTIDVGEAADIHPKDKLDVGERLALWALKNDYGRTSVIPSGPILRDVTASANKLTCSFNYTGSGLMCGFKNGYAATQNLTGGTLQRFSIAGADGVWYAGTAVINGTTVEVTSPAVSSPKKIAYACWTNPAVPVATPQTQGMLYNIEGLPASPFYVDDVTAKFTVTAAATTNGTISPAGATSYLKRMTALYTITPNSGFFIQDVLVDGVSVGAVKSYSFDPLYANHTISATFAASAPNFTVTASASAGGTISPGGAISLAQGGTQSFTITPGGGAIVSLAVDGKPMGQRTSYTIGDVRTNHTVAATFSLPINAQAGYGGTITPAGTTVAAYGGNQTYTIAPLSGFTISKVTVDGVNVGNVGSYTFNNVTSSHTITATFTGTAGSGSIPQTGQIYCSFLTDSLPASGNITSWPSYLPSGKTLTAQNSPSVELIDNRKFVKNIYNDYDCLNLGTISSPIPCTGTTIVTVAKPTRFGTDGNWYSIVDFFYDRLVLGVMNGSGRVVVRRNGSVDFSTAAIPDGQTTILSLVVQQDGTYKVFANGTQVMNVTTTSDMSSLVPGVAGGFANNITFGRNWPDGWTTYNGYYGDSFVYTTALSDTERQGLETYLVNRLTASGTTYTITSSAGTGGSISPAGSAIVNAGDNQTFTITPNSGYTISGVTVDGTSAGAVSSYTFNSVAANHTIAATFTATATTYTITASATTGGSISPAGAVAVNSSANQTFTITPNSGYVISQVTVDGTNQGAITGYTFTNVTANHTIAATFVPGVTYTITASAGTGGSISPSGSVIVNQGASQSFTITPNTGYTLTQVAVDSVNQGAITTYSFTNVQSNHTISATFTRITYAITASAGANGSINPGGTVTVNSGDNQTFTITPNSGYSVSALTVDGTGVASATSYTFSNVTANHTIAATFAATGTIPRTADLLFSLTTASLPASGNTGNWTRSDPTGGSFTTIATPTVDPVGTAPVKWAKNVYANGTGFSGGTQSAAVAVSGATIVTVIKPLRSGDTGNWRSIVDILYDQFCLIINNNTGQLGMRRGTGNGSGSDMQWGPAATIVPDQQSSVVSVVMAANGSYKMYINGTLAWTYATTTTLTQFYRSSLNSWGIGRNTFDGWSTYNGDIGDIYVWKTALSDSERASLEGDLMAKFHAGTGYPANTITASITGGGGTISPSGSISAPYEADQAFAITKSYGYACDVSVDGVSQGDISTYAFADVAAAHTITANYTALPTRTISGHVTAATLGGATVSVKMAAPNLPSQQTTTDSSGNYTMTIPQGVYYVCASQTGYMISPDTTTNATGDQAIDFTLTRKLHINGVGRAIPLMENLLFAADSNDLGAVGTSGNWPLLYNTFPVTPALTQLTAITTPMVTKVRGLKYDNNSRTDGDGYRLNSVSQNAAIPVNGASIVALVKPTRNATSDGFNSLVDVFYSNLILGIKNNTGQIQVRRNGTDYWSANDASHTIPDGQITILSLVLQSDGTFTVWASAWNNGFHTFGTPAVMLTNAVTSTFSALVPAQAGTDDFRKWINIGRNNPDGWSVFNGFIGDVFVYKTALSTADRTTLEADLLTKMNSIITYNISVITADAGTNGSISPAGVTAVGETDSLTYTITPVWGYDVGDVQVDGVSQGPITTYTFTNVTASHTINASFVAKPTYAISGKVSETAVGAPIAGAKIYLSTAANASSGPMNILTTDANGNYSVNLFNATWYLCASASGFTTSADTSVTVSGAAQTARNFALAASGKNIPQMSQLLFAMYGTALSGAASPWPLEHPKGVSAAVIGSPQVTTVNGAQWEQNRYGTTYDGYRVGYYTAAIPVNGLTATAVVEPQGDGINGGNWASVIDVMYSRFVLCVRGTDGMIRVNRNGEWQNGPSIPNGQKTILTAVVQPDGQYQVFANGIKVMDITTTSAMTTLDPYWNGGGLGFWSYINVGRNNPDGWTAYQGNIGAAFLWKTALTPVERIPFEVELGGFSGIPMPVYHTVTATAGAGGSISPSGTTLVLDATSQSFAIAADPGYEIADVMVDGVSAGAVTGYTFSNMLADHAIAASFRVPNSYSSWIAGYPGVGGATGFNDDPDADGINNGLENYLGTSPTQASASLAPTSAAGSVLKFRHTRSNQIATDVAADYQWSDDMTHWHSTGQTNGRDVSATIASSIITDTTAPDNDLIEVTVTVTGGTTGKIFARITATRAP